MEEEKQEEKTLMMEVTEKVENSIKNIMREGIQVNNIDHLYKLVDIHKDICNEEYWKKKEEVMDMRYRDNYGNYGNYGRESYGTDSYGRRMRDSRGRYRGEEMLDEMNDHYRRYAEGRDSYGGDAQSMKALEYMLNLDKEFIKMLMKDAKSPEEKEMIMEHMQEMSEM